MIHLTTEDLKNNCFRKCFVCSKDFSIHNDRIIDRYIVARVKIIEKEEKTYYYAYEAKQPYKHANTLVSIAYCKECFEKSSGFSLPTTEILAEEKFNIIKDK